MRLAQICRVGSCHTVRTQIEQERISQNHRTVGAGRDLQRSLSPTPCQIRLPTAGCTGRCPGGSWISPEKETPQPPLGSLFSAPSPSLWRSSYAHLCGTSCASVCGHFPLSCRHAQLKRVWPCPFTSHTVGIYRRWSDPLSVFCSRGCTDPGRSALPHRGDAPGPSSLFALLLDVTEVQWLTLISQEMYFSALL